MRDGLRRDLLAQKVIEHEVVAKVTVTDQDVTDFFNANRAQFNRKEDAYHIAQIAVTPVAEARSPIAPVTTRERRRKRWPRRRC